MSTFGAGAALKIVTQNKKGSSETGRCGGRGHHETMLYLIPGKPPSERIP